MDSSKHYAISQLELGIERPKEVDRNYHLGGRSFYFFDFDDNVAFLTTPIVLFHKETGRELAITSGEWAENHQLIGKAGVFADYTVRWDDDTGTFRAFRDHHPDELRKLGKSKQIFIEDVATALGFAELDWKGPSWQCFYHATFNQRPVSVITARGHAPSTIKEGIEVMRTMGHLPSSPNFLTIFPVSHKPTREYLGDREHQMSVAVLKQKAIRASVEMAIQFYGYSPHHRFRISSNLNSHYSQKHFPK